MEKQLIEFLKKRHKVSLETAKSLKEVRFDEGTMGEFIEYLTSKSNEEDGQAGPFGWKKGEVEYNSEYMINNHEEVDLSNKNYTCYAVPSHDEVKSWFLRNHNMYIEVTFEISKRKYTFKIINTLNKKVESKSMNFYSEPYEATEEGIKEACLLI